MLDRRRFLASMLGVAVAPKDVLSGIVTPAPIKKAVKECFEWVCFWKNSEEVLMPDGSFSLAECSFFLPKDLAHLILGAKVISGVKLSDGLKSADGASSFSAKISYKKDGVEVDSNMKSS